MGHSTTERLEHAEHTQHAAHDPFDRRVAVSMAIIAAVLAGVTLLSHRGHTETVRLQAEANSIQTEGARLHTLANIEHTKASDLWSWYQAKNIRRHEYESFLQMTAFLATDPGAEQQRKKARDDWASQVAAYKRELRDLEKKAKDREQEADEHRKEGEKKLEKAEESEHQSHQVHNAINWIDSGHLGIELALVLCSVAVLTKLRSFWFSGVVIALLGAALAGVGVYLWLLAPGAHL